MASPVKLLAVLFSHELRRLLSGRAYWAMILLLSPLAGYGYIEAVRLFGEASKTALGFPELARGMAPLDGILVPTLGAFYLGTTLFFPFVAIRALGQDKESGALKLTLQWSVSPVTLVLVKLLAVSAAWCMSLVIPLSALVLWQTSGGHLAFAETTNLFVGHAFYALTVAGIAFFATAISESAATAAILTLAFTLGFWVLDFAAASGPAWLTALGEISPTQALKQFERGLFSLPHALGLTGLGLGLVGISVVLLPSGHSLWKKIVRCTALIIVLAGFLSILPLTKGAYDLSEDRRNSFNPADEAALTRMDQKLTITLYLAGEDSRAREFSTNVLSKLKRLIPEVDVHWTKLDHSGPFAAAQDERYGLIAYEYAGRRAESRSNSPREILPLLYELAGLTVTPVDVPPYPGYPAVVATKSATFWFYGVLPTLFLFMAWRVSRPGRIPVHLSYINEV